MSMIPFLRACAGIHAKVDPVRLRYDPETGVQLLAQAVNVNIDQAGRVCRRKGLRKVSDVVNAHSLWSPSDQSKVYFVSSDALYRFNADGVVSLVKNGLQVNAAASMVSVGPDVYFTNGYNKGIIRNNVWQDWVETPYVGIETDRVFTGPPNGHLVSFYKGRVILGVNDDKAIWFSEPMNYGCFDQVRGYIALGGNINMIAPVDTGMYVSTDTAVYYLHGVSYNELEVRKVLDSPVVPGTQVTVKAEWVNQELFGLAVCFVAQYQGVVLGINDGRLLFLSKDRVDLPVAGRGVSVVDHNDNYRFLSFMEI